MLRWTDINDIATELSEMYPDEDPLKINFVTLRDLVMSIDDLSDDPNRCCEKVLEAIQMAWFEELD